MPEKHECFEAFRQPIQDVYNVIKPDIDAVISRPIMLFPRIHAGNYTLHMPAIYAHGKQERKRSISVEIKYCPFCGKELELGEVVENGQADDQQSQ